MWTETAKPQVIFSPDIPIYTPDTYQEETQSLHHPNQPPSPLPINLILYLNI